MYVNPQNRYVDSVLGAHAQHLQRIRSIIESEVLEPESVDPPPTKETSEEGGAKEPSELKKKKKKKKKPSNASTAVSTTEKVIEYAKPTRTVLMWQFLTSVKMQLTRGVFLVLASLTKAGHLTTTPPHIASHGLNDLEMLFAHRFKAFRLLSSPEALTFDSFLSRLDCDGLDVRFFSSLWKLEKRKDVFWVLEKRSFVFANLLCVC